MHKLQRTHLRLKVNIEVARLQQEMNEPSVLVVVWDISFRNSRDNETLEHIADSECNYATTQQPKSASEFPSWITWID